MYPFRQLTYHLFSKALKRVDDFPFSKGGICFLVSWRVYLYIIYYIHINVYVFALFRFIRISMCILTHDSGLLGHVRAFTCLASSTSWQGVWISINDSVFNLVCNYITLFFLLLPFVTLKNQKHFEWYSLQILNLWCCLKPFRYSDWLVFWILFLSPLMESWHL